MAKDTGIVNIHGKDYETVASRVKKFRGEHGYEDFSIVTEIVTADENIVVMKASILMRHAPFGEHDSPMMVVVATGHAEESRTASQINRTSALENCETSAIGRALAAFGMGGTEFASADEVAGAIHQQSAPKADFKQPLQGLATDKQRALIETKLAAQGIALEEIKGHLIEAYGVEIPLTKEGAKFVIDDLLEQSSYKRKDDSEPSFADAFAGLNIQ